MTDTRITKEDVNPVMLEYIESKGWDAEEYVRNTNKRIAREAGFDDGDGGDGGDGDSAEVEPFPVEALPSTLARLVKEGSKGIVCPPDMIGVPLLVAMTSAIGNSRVLHLKDGWDESAVLWATVVARPGDKKTPGAKVALKPAHTVGKRLRHQWKEKHDDWRKEMRNYSLDVKRSKGDSYEKEIGPEPLEPVLERTTVDDTTLEQLMVILDGNPRGVIQARDELDGWFRAMDQYKSGKGSDRQTKPRLWSSSPVAVDRKGSRESIALDKPFVCLYGTIQPEVLPELGDREDGLLDRFLYSYPEPVRTVWSDDGISAEAERGVLELYMSLRSLEMDKDEYGEPVPKRVRFSPEAKSLFVELFNEHRSEMDAPGFPYQLRGPWAKLESYFARLILLLTMMRCVENAVPAVPEEVHTDDVLRASVLLSYFKSNARKVFTDTSTVSRLDGFAKDLAIALEKNGGTLEGSPQDVWLSIDSTHKAKRAAEFSKDLKEIEKRTPTIAVEPGWVGRDKDKRRTLKVFLRNAVPAVPAVPSEGNER